MYAANAEIDELKDGLRYAEFKLSSVLQEKEQLEKERKSHVYQVGDLNMKLRQRDIEFQKKDEMFKQLEGALMQKEF
jgi:peptidoglycan hydrolase CwlO-like protein